MTCGLERATLEAGHALVEATLHYLHGDGTGPVDYARLDRVGRSGGGVRFAALARQRVGEDGHAGRERRRDRDRGARHLQPCFYGRSAPCTSVPTAPRASPLPPSMHGSAAVARCCSCLLMLRPVDNASTRALYTKG